MFWILNLLWHKYKTEKYSDFFYHILIFLPYNHTQIHMKWKIWLQLHFSAPYSSPSSSPIAMCYNQTDVIKHIHTEEIVKYDSVVRLWMLAPLHTNEQGIYWFNIRENYWFLCLWLKYRPTWIFKSFFSIVMNRARD